MNKMYKYLTEHNYVSKNKSSFRQKELSEERAECIACKYENLVRELQDENEKLKDAIQTYDILLKSNVENNKRLRKTIDEAIHYIECGMPYLQEIDKEYEDVDGNTDFTYKEYNGSDLLSILKGEKQ